MPSALWRWVDSSSGIFRTRQAFWQALVNPGGCYLHHSANMVDRLLQLCLDELLITQLGKPSGFEFVEARGLAQTPSLGATLVYIIDPSRLRSEVEQITTLPFKTVYVYTRYSANRIRSACT